MSPGVKGYSPTRRWLRREREIFHLVAVQAGWYTEAPVRGGFDGEFEHTLRFVGFGFIGPDEATLYWAQHLNWRLASASSAERRDR